jgi:hypothetical protein
MSRLPDFLVFGPPRTGTNWLHHNLNTHRHIFVPPGEPSVFCDAGETSIVDAYLKIFQEVADQKVLGEVSPAYFTCANAAKNIQQTIPTVKLIALLRDPAERAYAEYQLAKTRLILPTTMPLFQAIECYPHMLKNSSYGSNLNMYLELFPREQLFIEGFSRIKTDPEGLLREIFQFLGVDPEFISPSAKTVFTATGMLRYPWINNAIFGTAKFMRNHGMGQLTRWARKSGLRKRIKRWVSRHNIDRTRRYPKLSAEDRKMLIDLLLPEIERLEDLLHLEFSSWKEV